MDQEVKKQIDRLIESVQQHDLKLTLLEDRVKRLEEQVGGLLTGKTD